MKDGLACHRYATSVTTCCVPTARKPTNRQFATDILCLTARFGCFLTPNSHTVQIEGCKKDFLCFTFTVCVGDYAVEWDFDDGTVVSGSYATIEHCFTNVDTYTPTNATKVVKATSNGVSSSITMNLASFGSSIFIGNTETSSNLSAFTVLPGASHNGNNNTATADRNVYVYGRVNINKNFTFTATNVFVEPSGGFNVINGYQFELEVQTDAGPPNDCKCMWRGIRVRSGGILNTRSNTVLHDALYAVQVYRDVTGTAPRLRHRQTHFVNNYIGIMASPTSSGLPANFLFANSSTIGFSGNEFTTTAPLLDWCGTPAIAPAPFAPSGNIFSNTIGWAGIYLNEVDTFTMPNAAFIDIVNSYRQSGKWYRYA